MTHRYLNFQINNVTGGCYDWTVTLGAQTVSGALDEVKRMALAYACKLTQKKNTKKRTK